MVPAAACVIDSLQKDFHTYCLYSHVEVLALLSQSE